jgi:hypothetical protein
VCVCVCLCVCLCACVLHCMQEYMDCSSEGAVLADVASVVDACRGSGVLLNIGRVTSVAAVRLIPAILSKFPVTCSAALGCVLCPAVPALMLRSTVVLTIAGAVRQCEWRWWSASPRRCHGTSVCRDYQQVGSALRLSRVGASMLMPCCCSVAACTDGSRGVDAVLLQRRGVH